MLRLNLNKGLPILLACLPAGAGDLIEPWEAGGLTNVEAYLSEGDQPGDRSAQLLVGGRPFRNLSLGAAVADTVDGESRAGLIAVYTWSLGADTELDLYAEAGLQSATGEAELRDRADWLVGAEWSHRLDRVVPYARAETAGLAGEETVHGLGGLMTPLGSRVELHVELSSEWSEGTSLPLHVAVGPNVVLSPRVELIPEISVIRDRELDETGWVFTFGVVIDTSRPAVAEVSGPDSSG